MDRIDAMRVFIAALDEGSLAGAGRQLGRSPAAVSRAIAFLEQQVGAPLLHRTTRAIKLSEIGERYAAACRRVLVDLQEAEMVAAGEQAAPRGTLTVTAPPISGEEILRPIIDAYLEAFPAISVNLVLLDRNANLVEEGIDVALRVAELPDSSMVAVRVGGDVRRVVVASPRYLAQHPRIDEPGDLAKHRIVTTTHFGRDAWVFPPARGSSIARTVQFKPRLVVNSVRAALAAAVGRLGVTRLTPTTWPSASMTGRWNSCCGMPNPPPCRSTLSCRRGACRFPRFAPSWTLRSPACARSSQGCPPRQSR
jgi:DNA-binding transcriptional LysR family regulator